MEPTQREMELELQLWQTQVALMKTTIANCNGAIAELIPKIAMREDELKVKTDSKVVSIKE
jgi:hypothetical protein